MNMFTRSAFVCMIAVLATLGLVTSAEADTTHYVGGGARYWVALEDIDVDDFDRPAVELFARRIGACVVDNPSAVAVPDGRVREDVPAGPIGNLEFPHLIGLRTRFKNFAAATRDSL